MQIQTREVILILFYFGRISVSTKIHQWTLEAVKKNALTSEPGKGSVPTPTQDKSPNRVSKTHMVTTSGYFSNPVATSCQMSTLLACTSFAKPFLLFSFIHNHTHVCFVLPHLLSFPRSSFFAGYLQNIFLRIQTCFFFIFLFSPQMIKNIPLNIIYKCKTLIIVSK